jgi:hypothetical protein
LPPQDCFRFFLEAIGEAALPAGFVYLRDVHPSIVLAEP